MNYNLTEKQIELLSYIVEKVHSGEMQEPLLLMQSHTNNYIAGSDKEWGRNLLGNMNVLSEEGFLSRDFNSLGKERYTIKQKGNNFNKGLEVEEILVTQADPRKVFVVHGRNLEIQNEVDNFLRAIGLDPIEWEQARALTGKPNPYVGEILEAAFHHAQAIVVLLTPEDWAYLAKEYQHDNDKNHELEPTLQPRPNVLFEAGMAMGRDSNRTVLVQYGEIRPFSDIAGRHIIKLNNSSEKRHEFANRLKNAGCDVTNDGTKWYTAGDFEKEVKIEKDQRIANEDEAGLPEEILGLLLLIAETGGLTEYEVRKEINAQPYISDHYLTVLLDYQWISGRYPNTVSKGLDRGYNITSLGTGELIKRGYV